MKEYLKSLVKRILKELDIGILKYSRLEYLEEFERSFVKEFAQFRPPNQKLTRLLEWAGKSVSERYQDLFVLSELEFRRNGFFVEFGASNGFYGSNTYLLEKEFGWSGILAEPARIWHEELRSKRNVQIVTDCVWRSSGSMLAFNEAENASLSTISSFSAADLHRDGRKTGKTYDVRTISLVDLLDQHDAPRNIDYLSIDTEGSEYEILSGFDFDKYQFGVITCEHNFTPMREEILKLLTSNGYVRKFVFLSSHDDWYVRARRADP